MGDSEPSQKGSAWRQKRVLAYEESHCQQRLGGRGSASKKRERFVEWGLKRPALGTKKQGSGVRGKRGEIIEAYRSRSGRQRI